MRIVHENITLNPATFMICRDFDLPAFACPYHRHSEFEVLHIEQSDGRVLAGDFAGSFRAGEVYVFSGRLPHSFINKEGTQRARSRCLQFDAALLRRALADLPDLRSVDHFEQRAHRGLLLGGETAHAVSQALDSLFNQEGLMRMIELLRIIEYICKDVGARELASNGYSLRSPDRQLSRLERILNHIHERALEQIAMVDLAKHVGMSESALYRLFRSRMGCTPGAYIMDVRLSSIARHLLETDASITEIAFHGGFSNLSNFNRQFRRKFGRTPRAYRAMNLPATL